MAAVCVEAEVSGLRMILPVKRGNYLSFLSIIRKEQPFDFIITSTPTLLAICMT